MFQSHLLPSRPAWFPSALRSLAAWSFLTLPQLAALLATPKVELATQMPPLVTEGVVATLEPTRHLGESTSTPAYALTRFGARLLAAATASPVARVPSARKSLLTLRHDLARNELGVALTTLARRGQITLHRFEVARARIADAIHVLDCGTMRRIPLVADAFAVVGPSNRPTALLVEIDEGTVSAKRMREKFHGYYRWWLEGGPLRRFGFQSLRVLTLANTRTRVERLRTLAREATEDRAPGLFWFGHLDDVSVETPERLLGLVFRTAGDEALRTLLP